jgi:hypothetical protein
MAHSILFFLTVILLLIAFFSRSSTGQISVVDIDSDPPVNVGGNEDSDEYFTEDYDYSRIIKKKIYFTEGVNSRPIPDLDEGVIWVESVEDFHDILDSMDIPNVVRGISKLVSDGSYDELIENYGLRDHVAILDMGNPNGVTYRIKRCRTHPSDHIETFELEKWNSLKNIELNWRLSLKYDIDSYRVFFTVKQSTPVPRRVKWPVDGWSTMDIFIAIALIIAFLPNFMVLLRKEGKYSTPEARKAWQEFQIERRKKIKRRYKPASLAVDPRLSVPLVFYFLPCIISIYIVIVMPDISLTVTVSRVYSLTFLGLGLIALHNKRLIDDTPTLKTMGVFIGLAELKGTAESENPLTSHITETKCVHYSWRIEEQNNLLQWITVARGGESSPFYLQDDMGAIRIDPENATFYPDTALNVTIDQSDPLYYEKGPRSGVSNSLDKRIFTETLIPLHAPIYVIGHARERKDRVAVELAYDNEEGPLVISTKGEKQVSSEYRNQFLLLVAIGYIINLIVPWAFAQLLIRNIYFSSLIFVTALFLGWILVIYNSLVNLRNVVEQARAMIDIQLKRRSDLIPNLVEIMEGYTEFEKEIQVEVASLRAQSLNQDNPMGVADLIQSVVEAYPELKAGEQFLELQRTLEDTEHRIALSRDYYNQQTRHYNTRIEVIPDMYVARIGGFKSRKYWVAENFQRAQETIDFVS